MLDPQRQGEIALKLVKYQLGKQGVTISQDSMRRLGDAAKVIGVSIDELKEFFKPIVQELFNECFDHKK